MMAGAAHAGPQYVDETKFAVSGYDVVAYQSLEQAPVGQSQPEAVPGNASITAEYNGATWAFSSEENRDKFVANPEAYAPQFDGHCAYGVAQGGKVPANPNLWRIVDGKLYLNITPNVVGFWEENIPGQIATADGNWSGGLEVKDASPKSWKSINANDGTYSSEAPIDG
ncbi:MAG: YHS domain-containing (seleno)protein [Pseudomonadota bacterium]